MMYALKSTRKIYNLKEKKCISAVFTDKVQLIMDLLIQYIDIKKKY